MEKRFNISQFIENLGEDLVTVFSRSSSLGIHPDEVGKLKEINIAKQIESILPSGVGIGRGFVFDSEGNISNQCDLILYEKNLIPVFVRNENYEYSYFPCEGVIAVGEIKSSLTIEELKSSICKLEKIKTLKRNCKNRRNFRKFLSPLIAYGAESEMFDPIEKSYDNIFTFIFCKNNYVAIDTIFEILETQFKDHMEYATDRIYSLDKPIISRIILDDTQNVLWGNKKATGFVSIKTNTIPFGVLISDISTFVKFGRTQAFNFYDYYKTDDLYIEKTKLIDGNKLSKKFFDDRSEDG